MKIPKVYLAAPFFTPEQLDFVEQLESLITEAGYSMFSPRLGENALQMNNLFKQGGKPDQALRHKVFTDNVVNIDNADLMIAVIDNFDVGVMFEVGYAYRCHVPVVTITDNDYGCNLMLAQSIIGHVKSVGQLNHILEICNPRISLDAQLSDYGEAIVEVQSKYRTELALVEGPAERDQFKK